MTRNKLKLKMKNKKSRLIAEHQTFTGFDKKLKRVRTEPDQCSQLIPKLPPQINNYKYQIYINVLIGVGKAGMAESGLMHPVDAWISSTGNEGSKLYVSDSPSLGAYNSHHI